MSGPAPPVRLHGAVMFVAQHPFADAFIAEACSSLRVRQCFTRKHEKVHWEEHRAAGHVTRTSSRTCKGSAAGMCLSGPRNGTASSAWAVALDTHVLGFLRQPNGHDAVPHPQ